MFHCRNFIVNKVNLADIKNEIISLHIYELDSFVRMWKIELILNIARTLNKILSYGYTKKLKYLFFCFR